MKLLGVSIFLLLIVTLMGGILFINRGADFRRNTGATVQNQMPTSTPRLAVATTTIAKTATTTVATSTPKKIVVPAKKVPTKAPEATPVVKAPPVDPSAATRIENPYPFPPESFT